MKSKTCKDCPHYTKYSTSEIHFCANSLNADVISIDGESLGLFNIEKPTDVKCNSYKSKKNK